MIYKLLATKRSNSNIKGHCSDKPGKNQGSGDAINQMFKLMEAKNDYFKSCGCGCEDTLIAEENN